MNYCSACGTRLLRSTPTRCDACGIWHWRNAKPSASALVTYGGALLLVERKLDPWSGYWDVPGGFCEAEEHPISAAERETLEETGLSVEVTGYLGAWLDRYPSSEGGRDQITLNLYYHAIPTDAQPSRRPLPETRSTGWYAPNELPTNVAFPEQLSLVLQAWRREFLGGRTLSSLPDRPSGLRNTPEWPES
jgi:8-oxo-dGTP diphosphatase